jgi:glutamine---fructose-6-phosphate transaminase (isomerizing)
MCSGKVGTRMTQVGDAQNQFISITGYAEEIAYEGALKIKEMCYLQAKGYSGGALQHVPFAVIEDDTGNFGATPIIMFILDDQHAYPMQTAAKEVKAPGCRTYYYHRQTGIGSGFG